jgi:tetratricopeptide (TPR) repeat protein
LAQLSTTSCPDESLVLRYLGGLAREHATTIEQHVDSCRECREWIGMLARTSLGLPSATLPHVASPRPGEFLPMGTELGRYRIVRVRGQGGIGVVYEAEDPELRRRVALKVLRTAIADADAPRLLAEARAMAKLSHPHVCPVLDVGALEGRWFLAMSLVEGGTLAQWLARGEHTRAEILDRFDQAGRGVLAAHRVGVVHRDFKPSNVLLDGDGRALVSDFGLAIDLLHAGGAGGGGTPHYMAPEQRDGGGDARVDQYAFGVALRDALAHHEVPAALRKAIGRATAADPALRFSDMAELLDALARSDRARAPARRWLVVVAATGAVAAVLGGVANVAPEPATGGDPAAAPEVSASVEDRLEHALLRDRGGDTPGAAQELDDAVAFAEASGDPAGLALARIGRGEHLGKRGRFAEAIAELEHAFHLAVKIGRDDLAADAAIVRVNLLATDLARPEEAALWARHLEATLARADGLDASRRAGLEEALGRIEEAQGERERARDRFRRSAALLEGLRPGSDAQLAQTLSRLALAETALGELAVARGHFAQAIEVGTAAHGRDSKEVATAWGNLAFLEREAGDYPTAHAHLVRARATISRVLGEDHLDVIAIDSNLAALSMQLGRHDEAIAQVEQALPRAPADMRVTCVLHEQLGLSLRALDERRRARAALRDAIACYDRVLGPGSEEATLVEADLVALPE